MKPRQELSICNRKVILPGEMNLCMNSKNKLSFARKDFAWLVNTIKGRFPVKRFSYVRVRTE